MIMVVNTSFPELNQLAAGLSEAGLLSTYVRPYANLQRGWELRLSESPGLGKALTRTFGRRRMPKPLRKADIIEAGIMLDFVMAAHSRLPATTLAYEAVRQALMNSLANTVAKVAAKTLIKERAVVASWGCAEPVFRRMKTRGGLCVLNYSLAHHRFTRYYLLEEAKRLPAFATTLNSHNPPAWLERRFDAEIELADRILIGSSFVRDSFISEGVPNEKLVVVPYGVDTTLFEPLDSSSHPSRDFRLLFVGQISQRKGIFYLLEAARRMQDSGISVTLVGKIQGSGRELEAYRHLFRHIPHVPHTELREIYRQADVFVFPTLVEGMGLVLLEAMASGLPVVTTPNGPGDIVRDATDGYLVPPRNVDVIVDRLERLKADPELRIEMGRNARQRALEFTWFTYGQTVVSHLKSWLDDEKKVRLMDWERSPSYINL